MPLDLIYYHVSNNGVYLNNLILIINFHCEGLFVIRACKNNRNTLISLAICLYVPLRLKCPQEFLVQTLFSCQ